MKEDYMGLRNMGFSLTEISRMLGLNRKSLYLWRKKWGVLGDGWTGRKCVGK